MACGKNKNMFRFETLEIWKESIEYAREIYVLTKKFPKEELFGLTDQLRRAVFSIANNIAEGSGSATTKNFCSFLDISIKSALETVNCIIFAEKLGYISASEKRIAYEKAERIIKRIRTFKRTLNY
jgi:four helix bundle protein